MKEIDKILHVQQVWKVRISVKTLFDELSVKVSKNFLTHVHIPSVPSMEELVDPCKVVRKICDRYHLHRRCEGRCTQG
jgi:hypothetical protein